VKVLDFGLAKLRQPLAAAATAQEETARLVQTSPGMIIGSALYMAPERLEGGEADERSDIFSFGMVMYEMLAGRQAFSATTTAGAIAAILATEPAPFAESLGVHEELDWLVRRCLAKTPDDRWQSMRDIQAVLKRHARRGAGPVTNESRPPRAAVAAVLTMAAAVGMVGWPRWDSSARRVGSPIAFRVEPPSGGAFTPTSQSVQAPMFAVSPDGASLAFVGSGSDGISQLWIRQFGTLTPRAIAGTAGALVPFWSPDGRSLAFFSSGLLKRVDVEGGLPRTLAPSPCGCGGTWSSDGVILFAPKTDGGLMRVSADGGPVAEQTRLDLANGETSHRWPKFVGDGRFIYFARSIHDRDGIYLASLDGSESRLLVHTTRAGEFLPPDRLLYLSEGALLSRAFDVTSGTMRGNPVVIADRVGGSSNFYPGFSSSPNGTIAFAAGASTSELVWHDRDGQRLPAPFPEAGYVDFRISPDNKYLAVAEIDPRTDHPDLYLLDLARGTRERMTSTRVTEATPTWSPDSRQLLFRANPGSVHDVFRREVFTLAPESPFLKSAHAKFPTSWFGNRVLLHAVTEQTRFDVWLTTADKSAPPRPLIQTPLSEAQAQFSPDGRWIAYSGEETPSKFEVFVQAADGAGPRWAVSAAGGSDPHWNPAGSELFFVSADHSLMSVRIAATGEPGRPERLFRMPDIPVVPPYLSAYDVSRDGRRFLVRVPVEDVRTRPLTIVMNADVSSSTSPLR
jgi:Tol biopolymer transport system component